MMMMSLGLTTRQPMGVICVNNAPLRHSDKNSAATNNHFLDFVQTRGLISLVNDNHLDNNLMDFGACIRWLDCK